MYKIVCKYELSVFEVCYTALLKIFHTAIFQENENEFRYVCNILKVLPLHEPRYVMICVCNLPEDMSDIRVSEFSTQRMNTTSMLKIEY
jgi:hypothetical protein